MTNNNGTEAESALLGALLAMPELYPQAEQILAAEDFSVELHQTMYANIGKIYRESGKLDLILLLESLGETNKARHKEYLMRLADSVPVIANAMEYAKITKQYSIGRRAAGIIAEADLRGTSGPGGIPETVQETAEKLAELVRDKNGARSRPLEQILDEICADVFEDRADTSLKTGFGDLDAILDGIDPGNFIVIGAGTSVGKSALMLQIVANMAKAGKKILLYTLEMTDKENMRRIISHISGVELEKLKRSDRTNAAEKDKVLEALHIASKYIIEIQEAGGLKASDIRLDCVKNKGIDIIFIDHVGLMRGERPGENRARELSSILQDLRAISLTTKIPIVGLAQLNREAKDEATKNGKIKYTEPQLHHFKDSSEYEQSAMMILLMWRMPGYDDKESSGHCMLGLKVAKNRQGRRGKLHLRFDEANMTFRTVKGYEPPRENEKWDKTDKAWEDILP